jgi:hypothetical protein
MKNVLRVINDLEVKSEEVKNVRGFHSNYILSYR